MQHRLEPRFDVEISRSIDAPRRCIGVLNGGNGNVRRCRQIGLTILRSQIMAALFAPSGTGTLGTQSLGGRHRRVALALKWQVANLLIIVRANVRFWG